MRRYSKKNLGGKYVFWPVWVICGFIVLTMAAASIRFYLDQQPKESDIAVVDVPEDKEIRFRSTDFPTGELRLFRVTGTGIILAVKRLADGHVHVAVSSCTVCSRQGHKSYARKNELFCGVCNQPMRFEKDEFAASTAKGQCPLPEVRAVDEEGTIVIATQDVVRVADQALMK